MATNPNAKAGLKKFEDTTIAFENMIIQVGRAIARAQREMDVTQIEFQKDVTKALREGKISRLDIRPMNAYTMPETSLALKIGMTMTYPEGSTEPTLSAVPLNASTTNQNDVSVEAATEINLKFVTVPDSKQPVEPEVSALTELEVRAVVEAHWMSVFAVNNVPGLNTVLAYMPEERIWIYTGLSATEPAYTVLVSDRTGAILDVILKPYLPAPVDVEPVGAPQFISVSPAQAKVGELLTITGDNFATLGGQTILKVDGKNVPIVRMDMTTISFKFPGWVALGNIEVVTPLGTTGQSGYGSITPLPTMSYADPLKGYYDNVSNTGSWVTVYGYNFNVDIDFRFANGATPKSLKLVSANQIEIQVSQNAVSGPIYLENKSVPGYKNYSSDLFIMMPRVDRVSPRQGVVGEVITIRGNSLSEVTSLILGDIVILAVDFTLHTDDEIRFLLPARAFDGKFGLYVGTTGAPGIEPTVWTRDIFYVVPKITGFSTTIANRGEIITVNGEGLDPDATMMTLLFEGYGGISEAPVLSVAADRTYLTTRVPSDAATGYVMLIRKKIFSGSNAADTSNTTDNKVTVLTTSGLPADLLHEERFDTDLTGWTTQSGTWSIDQGRLMSAAGSSRLAYAFAAAQPQITLYADVLSGESFGFFIDIDHATIAGYDVTVELNIANPVLTWKQVPISGQPSIVQQSPLTIPNATNYLVKLSVVADTMTLSLNQTTVTDSYLSGAVSILGFSLIANSALQRWDNVIAMKGDYLALPKPGFYRFGEIPAPPLYPEIRVDTYSPTKGPIGTQVTLTGIGLDANASFYFGTVLAQVVTVTGTSATIIVPDGAKSGTIKVTGRGGVIAATKDPFILPPVITGFIPDSVRPGDHLTIIGENLPTNPLMAQVQIMGILATVLAATSSALTVLIPEFVPVGPMPITLLYEGFMTEGPMPLNIVWQSLFYDMRLNASQAVWSNALGVISFGGVDASGALVMTRNPQKMEDQFSYESVLVLNPPPVNLRALRGEYPVMDFPPGGLELQLSFGAALSDSAVTNELLETQNVKFEVSFVEELSGAESTLLPRTLCVYDTLLESFNVDLSSIAGLRGQIVLSVFAGDGGGFEAGVVQAEIVSKA